ncbi:MAG TPA: zinc-binding dehydrogenase [Chthonomonadaceae bacterium]|nr:zinc-binding dehydrogenase [Chthonomonadaceae bacterium]
MPTGYQTIFAAPNQVILEPQEWGSPGPGQALIRTECTLISTGTELTALTADFPPVSSWANWIQFPTGIGYSNVARVVEVGEGVEHVKVGDRVANTGNHATYRLFPANHLWPVPARVDAEAASFSTLAEIVLGGVRLSRLIFGEAVVIIGAGLIGQLAARFCRIAGAWPILVVDPAEQRLAFLRETGFVQTLPMWGDQVRPEVERLTKGRMADVVFDVTGNPIAMQGALRLARRKGRVVVLGSPRGPVSIDFHEEVHTQGLEIIGAHNSMHPSVETPHAPWTMARDVELFLEWQDAGVVDVRPLITHRYSWREVAEAYRMLTEDRTRALGVILDWSAEP